MNETINKVLNNTGNKEIENLLQTQSDKIFILYLILAAVTIIAITFIIIYFVKRHQKNTMRVGIHMPSGDIDWFTVPKTKKVIRIDHGKKTNGQKDIFSYLYDQECVVQSHNATLKKIRKLEGFDRYNLKAKEEAKGRPMLQFYYRNPNPIDFNSSDIYNVATVRQQNIDAVLESDTIQKFVLSGTLLSTLQTLVIIILVVAGLGLVVSGIGAFGQSDSCSLNYDNQTLQVINIGTHMGSSRTASVVNTTVPVGVAVPISQRTK